MSSVGRFHLVGVMLCGAAPATNVRADEMLVADCLGHSVHRYDENGQWLGDFVPPQGGSAVVSIPLAFTAPPPRKPR